MLAVGIPLPIRSVRAVSYTHLDVYKRQFQYYVFSLQFHRKRNGKERWNFSASFHNFSNIYRCVFNIIIFLCLFIGIPNIFFLVAL